MMYDLRLGAWRAVRMATVVLSVGLYGLLLCFDRWYKTDPRPRPPVRLCKSRCRPGQMTLSP